MSSKGHKPGKDPGSDDNTNDGGNAGGSVGGGDAGGGNAGGGDAAASAPSPASVADPASVSDPATGVAMENWEVSAVDTLVDDLQHNNPPFCPTCKAWTSPSAVVHLSEAELLEASEGYRAHQLAAADAPDSDACATCGNRANPTSVAHMTLEEALAIKPGDTKPGEAALGGAEEASV